MKALETDGNARKKTILLVDDEPVNLKVMSQILKGGYRLMLATSGEEALRCVGSPQPPDLILLDIVMPEMDGFEVCRQLREHEITGNIPVIFVTGRAGYEEITAAMEAGGADCIRKPVHPDLLKARIRTHLALKRYVSRKTLGQDMVAAALQQEKDACMAVKGALRKAQDELDALKQYRHIFLAEMHHEIKTHLTTIVGMAGLALKLDMSLQLADYITTIRKATDTLVALINDIVELSMLEDGNFEIKEEEFSPEHLVNDVFDACGELALTRDVELVVDTSPELPARLIGSAARIRQLLTHLMHFNIKWLESRRILIETRGHYLEPGMFMLEFTLSCLDAALTDREARELFNPIDTHKSSWERQTLRNGLGPVISRRIVEKMSGRIDAEADSDSGVKFRCAMPLKCMDTKPLPLLLATGATAELNVLVADDSPLAAGVTAKMLTAAGCRVDVTEGWEEVLEKFPDSAGSMENMESRGPYDLLIIDWKMPGMDGIEVARRLRLRGVDIPVIIAGLPALLMMTMLHNSEKAGPDGLTGATAFIMKPVKRESLFEKINELLNNDIRGGMKDEISDESGANAGLKGLRVLLVEDNAINRRIASQLLEMAGMEVTGVAEGRIAVDTAFRYEFDVILMDIELPDISGVEAAGRITALPACKNIPVIALTAHSWPDHKQAYRDAGMRYCIEKPIDPDKLYAKITEAVST